MHLIKLGVLLGIVFCSSTLPAQTFRAGVIAGLNASQVDGDQLAGFDKLGLTAGVKGTARLTEKSELGVELLYTDRGSRPDIFDSTIDPDIQIKLQYIEVPVTFIYKDWLQDEGYYKVHVSGGLSVGRLIQARTFDHFNPDDENLDNLVDEFNENDLSWLLGFGINANENLGFSFRYTRSLTLLLNAQKKNLTIPSLRPYSISFRAEYLF